MEKLGGFAVVSALFMLTLAEKQDAMVMNVSMLTHTACVSLTLKLHECWRIIGRQSTGTCRRVGKHHKPQGKGKKIAEYIIRVTTHSGERVQGMSMVPREAG